MLNISNSTHSEIANLNANFQCIGKYTRNGINWSKSFLSFGAAGHLNIRQLNPLQILARRYFGFYKETYLENAIHGWIEFQIKHGNVCPELSEKLAALWMKSHAEQILLPVHKAFFIGNSAIENAEVIGIGELFSHRDNPKFCCELLSKNYREGDVILVEGIDAERTVSSRHNFQTASMTPTTEVYGWEPLGYEALFLINQKPNDLVPCSRCKGLIPWIKDQFEKSYKNKSKGNFTSGSIRKVAAILPCGTLKRKMIPSIKATTVKNARRLFRNIFKMKKDAFSTLSPCKQI